MRSGLKTSVENDIFWSEIAGQDLENQAAHPYQEFPGVPPPPYPAGRNGKPYGNNETDFKCCSISPDVNFHTVNPLLSPPGAFLFQANMKGGLIETGGLFNLETTMVSIFHKELEYKVEKLKYKKF